MKKKLLILFGSALGLMIIIAAAYYKNITTRNAVEKLAGEKRLINILVAGSGIYNRNMHKHFALVTINPVNNNIGVTFIPPSYSIRDSDSDKGFTRIDNIDFTDFKKIKNAFMADLKIHVPFYVELYSPDVRRIIDLIEGIDIFILDQVKNIPDLHPGLNYFDGSKALKYIHSSQDNSIFSRYDRMQDIILNLYYNKERKKIFGNLKFVTEILKTIKTNMLPREFVTAGDFVFKKGHIMTSLLPGVLKEELYTVDDISYKIYEEDFMTPLVVGKFSESQLRIKIVNGSDVPGLARKLRNSLIKEGLSIIEFGTSPYREISDSMIICRKGNIPSLDKISKLSGIKNIQPVIDNALFYNVLIITGKDMVK